MAFSEGWCSNSGKLQFLKHTPANEKTHHIVICNGKTVRMNSYVYVVNSMYTTVNRNINSVNSAKY